MKKVRGNVKCFKHVEQVFNTTIGMIEKNLQTNVQLN